jgi:hypothetical protein
MNQSVLVSFSIARAMIKSSRPNAMPQTGQQVSGVIVLLSAAAVCTSTTSSTPYRLDLCPHAHAPVLVGVVSARLRTVVVSAFCPSRTITPCRPQKLTDSTKRLERLSLGSAKTPRPWNSSMRCLARFVCWARVRTHTAELEDCVQKPARTRLSDALLQH